ncbi:ornithine cyclodeaminase family protein [Agaricicola taiwanensis]|nr:ornithine cyclodeaminase family protein [Agaricicola taiwanensis]
MLFINNDVVRQVLDMPACITAQEEAFARLITGESVFRPRIDMYVPCDRPDGYYRWGDVVGTSHGVLAVRLKSDIVVWPEAEDGTRSEKKFCMEPGTYCGLVFLFSTGSGEPLALMNDGYLQQMRVGGAAGIGARLLSRPDSHTVGVIGSGGMARTFLRAICAVRDITAARVFSPNAHHRESYAAEMSDLLGIEVVAVDTAREAVRGVDIIATATDSLTPVIQTDWLEPGQHVSTLGLREIAPETVMRFDVVVQQGREGLDLPESRIYQRDVPGSMGAYVAGTEEEQKRIPRGAAHQKVEREIPVYTDVISGKAGGRQNRDQITQYHTFGNWGVQFPAVGAHVFRRAKELGLGHDLPTEWFLQDIRN